jgi:hypothetical protein
MPKLSRGSWKGLVLFFVLAFCLGAQFAFSQASISAGNIVGTVADESGAVVPGAKVTITNKATGQQLNSVTNSSGIYNSGPLTPGEYTVRVEAAGFTTTVVSLTVQVNNTSNGNISMHVG